MICKYCIVDISHVNSENFRDFVLLSLLQPDEIKLGQRIFGQDIYIDSVVITPHLRAENASYMFLSLLVSGDIQMNPGPGIRRPKHPCTVCSKGVIATSKAVECNLCTKKTHIRCISNTARKEYENITEGEKFRYICIVCQNSSENIVDSPSLDSNNIGVDDIFTTTSNNDDMYKCFDRKGMHFIHLNIRSLLPKMSEVRIIAQRTKAAVIAMSETWLDPSIQDSEVDIEGYSVIRKDRNRKGGGVCIYINNKFAFARHEVNTEGLECVFAEIHLPKTKPFIVGIAYRPPQDQNFLSRFEDALSELRSVWTLSFLVILIYVLKTRIMLYMKITKMFYIYLVLHN